MSVGTPSIAPASFAALSQSTFGAAVAPQPQQTPPSALSGGAVPPTYAPQGAPVGGAPFQPQYPPQPYAPSAGPQGAAGMPTAPVPPVANPPIAPPVVAPAVVPTPQYQPPQIPPQYQQAPPTQPTPQQTTPPSRYVVDQLVARGTLRPEEAVGMDDWQLFNYLLEEPRTPPAAPTPPAPQTTPSTPAPAPATPAMSQLQLTAAPLLQAGVISEAGGFYTTNNQAFAPIAAQLNADRAKEMQTLAAQQAQQALTPELQGLKQTVEQLQAQIKASLPKPYEAWVNQHKEYLHVKDVTGRVTEALSPAGQIYDRVWKDMYAKGVTDESILHTASAAAVEGYWRSAAPVQPVTQQAPQQSFMQAVQNAPYNPTPGFNLPGQNLSAQNSQTVGPPRTPQGLPDWDAYRQQALNGTLPPV